MERMPRFIGVYFNESEVRRHNGKPDRCFYITYKEKGKKVWEKIGWTSEGYTAVMASQVRAERLRTLRHGEELPKKKEEPSEITFGQAWDKYLKWAKTDKLTFVSDEERYNLHIKPYLASKTLSEITPLDIQDIKARVTDKGRAAQTVKHVLGIIRQVYNKAIQWKLYHGENPVSEIKMPSTQDNKRLRFLTHDEAHQLLEEISKHSQQLYEMCLVSLHTGMRAKELFQLRWGDVDLDHRILHVRGKGEKGKGLRQAHITDTMAEMFGQKERGESKDLVWTARDGGPITAFSDTFQRVADRLFNAGVEDPRHKVVPHTMRHTFASWLAIQGTPLLEIKELMGHQNIEMTMRYAHLAPDRKRLAVQSLDATFNDHRPDRPSEPSKE